MQMKYMIKSYMTLAAIVALSACTFNQGTESTIPLSVNPTTIDFTEYSGTTDLTLKSSSEWEVSSMPSWVSVLRINSAKSALYEWAVSIYAPANEGDERQGIIEFRTNQETVSVSVRQDRHQVVVIPVESISLSSSELTLETGSSATLTYTIRPSDATNQNVNWHSNNESCITVSNGVVTALAVGSARITVTTEDGGKTATCNVTVQEKKIPVTGVSLDKTSLTLAKGEKHTLSVNVTPADASNKKVNWSSSNESVANVSSMGEVTAVSVGTATITATTEDGEKTATCTVTVVIPVESVSLNKTSLIMNVDEKQTLSATVKPSDATNQNISWSSSNESVATVNSSGEVTARTPGSATITVTTEDGSKTATCNVTVNVPVESVSLNKTSLVMTEGEKVTISADVKPSDAANKKVVWTSSNASVATVSSSGEVTAIAVGYATITVTTEDKGKTATCSVTVKAKDLDSSNNENTGEEEMF